MLPTADTIVAELKAWCAVEIGESTFFGHTYFPKCILGISPSKLLRPDIWKPMQSLLTRGVHTKQKIEYA